MKDKDFFERLEPIRGRLYRMAYPYFNSESMAIDAVDEAVYKGYLKKNQLKEEAFFETWMVRILLNVCNTKYKKTKDFVCIEELSETAVESEFDSIDLKEAIQRLPAKYKQIILLKFFSGYGIVEIAGILEIPQGTVASRLRKALATLRIDLTEGDINE